MSANELKLEVLRTALRTIEDPESQAIAHSSRPGDLRGDALAVSFIESFFYSLFSTLYIF